MTDFEQPNSTDDEFVWRLRQVATPAPCSNVEQTFYAAGWAAATEKDASTNPVRGPNAATKSWRLFSTGAFSGFAAACLLWMVQINLTPNTPDHLAADHLAANPSPHTATLPSDINTTAEQSHQSLPLEPTIPAVSQNSTMPINTTKEEWPQRQTRRSPWQQILFGPANEWSQPVVSQPTKPKPVTQSLLWQVADARELLALFDQRNPSAQYVSTLSADSTKPQQQPTLRFGPITSEVIDRLFE